MMLVIFFSNLLWTGCSPESTEINFGKDVCAFCKMQIIDPKFGAVLATEKGKVFKFDDLNCMLQFGQQIDSHLTNYKSFLAIDYSHPGTLIDAKNAFFLKSERISTPMNGQVISFSNKDSLDSAKRKFSGVLMVWGELITQFR